jgi:hypothetical protein
MALHTLPAALASQFLCWGFSVIEGNLVFVDTRCGFL